MGYEECIDPLIHTADMAFSPMEGMVIFIVCFGVLSVGTLAVDYGRRWWKSR